MRMKDDDWDAVISTPTSSPSFRACRACGDAPDDEAALNGRIVSITSVVGASGNPGQANYAAAKAGVAQA